MEKTRRFILLDLLRGVKQMAHTYPPSLTPSPSPLFERDLVSFVDVICLPDNVFVLHPSRM